MKLCLRTAVLISFLLPLHFADEAQGAITTLDLTTIDTTYFGTSDYGSQDFIFTTIDVGSSGTGTINTFLDIQASPFEQGYNSTRSSGVYDEKNFKQSDNPADSGTRGLNVNEVPFGTIQGDQYGEFLLDANEGGAIANQDLSIWQIQIFAATDSFATDPTLTPTGTTSTTDGVPIVQFDSPDAVEVFRLSSGDTSYEAVIDASLGSGSGTFDLRFFWDVDLLLALDLTTYTHLIVYTYMGNLGELGSASNGGFEEWSVSLSRSPFTETLPEPGTWALLLMTACGALFFQYRQKRKLKLAEAESAE